MSDTAIAGAAGISAYCASKHAVRGLVDSLRMEVCARPPPAVLHAVHSTINPLTLLCGRRASCGCLQLLHTDVGLHMACPSFVNTSMIRTAQKDAVMGFLLC